MIREEILEGLNPEQRRAVEATTGPVCILAGAGTGKTTTITRRIAYQVATGAFAAEQILAVTFTEKAATEMRERLTALGVTGVRARTFHASALQQLTFLLPQVGSILPSKAFWLRQIANALPRPYRFRSAADLATEVEWAKNRRLTPEHYFEGLGSHEPPIPAELMHRVFARYETRKRSEGRIDFEDVLELLVRHYEANERDLERLRSGCRAITVDEYQDVNLLQQSLLDLWLGNRDDLCVVGDDYQSIYSFTGATPRYLLELPRRFTQALVVRLECNYRSSPEILALANRLVPRLGGAAKTLRATSPSGPSPELRLFASAGDETSWIVERARALAAGGVACDEMAILYRVNSRSEDLEAPLAAAGIPYQVRGGGFLDRPAARDVVRRLRRAGAAVAPAVEGAAREEGMLDAVPDDLGQEEATRQADLRRLIELARSFPEGGSVPDFLDDLEARFRSDGDGRGVQLLTYHRAKGLEFDAVFLPFLQEGELPSRQARSDEAVAEERRLLYVGLTRARRELAVTAVAARPSRFLRELGVTGRPPAARARTTSAAPEDDPLFDALRSWRLERARADAVPAYVVFDNKTLAAIAERRPSSLAELASVPGVGPVKLERYGEAVLELTAR